ncbi:MAG: hypothetical protein MUC95_07795 [Spirochaetes bacterium]|nr:hypothetical protein [Spirochaetota bacterium]
MNQILLLTYNNNYYKNYLNNKEFQILEFHQPLSNETILKIEDLTFSLAVLELNDNDIDIHKKIIDIAIKKSAYLTAVSGNITEKIKYFLMKNGIADLFESENPEALAEFVNIINNKKTSDLGRILILEDDNSRNEILKSIITRFGYEPVIINSIDILFEKIEASSFQMILLNLGTSGFDVNKFTRKSKLSNTIKKLPVIPYKDMNRGLYIHEMLTGLNKVAGIILSPEEVFSFLIDILFRKEFLRTVNKLNISLNEENMQLYSQETLGRIYNILGTNIFSMKNILLKDNIENLKSIIDSAGDAIAKVQGLRWLRMK